MPESSLSSLSDDEQKLIVHIFRSLLDSNNP